MNKSLPKPKVHTMRSLLTLFILTISGWAWAQPTCPEYTSVGDASSPYILTSDPDCAICDGMGADGPWSGFGCAGTIVSTTPAPVLSLTLAYTAVNTDDYATISIDGGGVMTITGENVGVSGDVIGPYLCGGSYGDIFITVTSTLPFTTVTLVNTGCSSGWVIACPGGDAEAGDDGADLACSGIYTVSDLLTPDAELGGTWTETTGSGEFDPATSEFDVDAVAPGIYTFEYEVLGCDGTTDVAVFTIEVGDEGNAGDDNTSVLCNSPGSLLDMNSLLVGADAGGTWEETTTSGQFDPVTGEFDAEGLPPGDYTFTYSVLGTAPCPDDIADFTVTVNFVPTIDAGDDVALCEGDDVTLTADNPDGVLISWDGGVTDGVAFTPGATMTYTVTADNDGCIAIDDITVTVNPYPTIDAGTDIEVCADELVTLIADNPDGAVISWDGGVIDGTPFSPPSGTTTYTVTADLTGCISTDDIDITVNPLPIVDIESDPSPAQICFGESMTLTASGAGFGGTYVWDPMITNGTPFIPDGGTELYTVTVTDANGCSSTGSIPVEVYLLPVVVFEADTLYGCDPLKVNFVNLTTTPGVSCQWDFGDGFTDVGCSTVSHTYTEPGEYTVALTVATADICSSTATYNNYITVAPQPRAIFSSLPSPVTIEDTDVSFTNLSIHADSYEWYFGDGSTLSNAFEPNHLYPNDPNVSYPVTLVAMNDEGCSDTVRRMIIVEDVIIFYVPNTFTPDGDDFNEEFKPIMTSGYDPYNFSMTIYNRWGEIMFQTYNAGVGWNGTYQNGELVADGVYVWRIEFGDTRSDKRHEYMGHITVLK
ncbi:PKD domain-containing protein [Crocinitomicaceae bacterium]|nr:PKD domain-containing protein [Crocinitomicaceae bacterium]